MDEKIKDTLKQIFEPWADEKINRVSPLPPSGSDRRYFRIFGETKQAIAAINPDKKENRAFLTFSKHFRAKGLSVPEIYSVNPEDDIYLQEDLGDTTLFSYLTKVYQNGEFPRSLLDVYKKVIRLLPEFQITAGKDLDYSVCYPRSSFDRQSMMWDLNYFKYYFLKLARVRFDEQELENDFQTLTHYLLSADRDYFLYRDFQSRNIMLQDCNPYFIDYQGGRKGALQYDIASLLFDGKANIPNPVREELLNEYIDAASKLISINEKEFTSYYYGYVLIRIMQAMGSYGFRGFYEKKEHFLLSIPFALKNLDYLLKNLSLPIEIKTLEKALHSVVDSKFLKQFGQKSRKLKVTINSFSYKKGIPADNSGNGGGFVFDCRALPNPGRQQEYKLLTGRDQEVIDYLEAQPEVHYFFDTVTNIVDQSVKNYMARKFSNLMVNFGCTGGQHRSVYSAERLATHLKSKYDIAVDLHHIEQEF